MSAREDILERAGAALLALAAEREWREISLRDIAEKAGVGMGELYPLADGRLAVLAALSARFDAVALAAATETSADIHDRLFEAAMARIEAMEPHRDALIAIARSAGPLILAPHLPRTARSILEAAGVNATPPRLAAMTAVWARAARVWRDDEGALNRTMAEIDLRLKQMRRRLKMVRAGF
ncbi:MAG TPA: TetR family transcriptional regulator [Caulobacteraceae bacterium]